MSNTIIDSLVVLFGLDPTGYKKGADEVAKAQDKLDAKTKRGVISTDKEEKDLAAARKKRANILEKQSNDTVKSIGEVGRSLATMLIGFEGVTGFAKWMASLTAGEAQLGRTALKIDMSAHELNKWGNATALAGGKAEDAQEAFGRIATEFNTSRVTGQIGPLLTFLRARGVAVSDANGKLRNQGQILEELADKTAQYGAVYQANMFRQAGLNEGEIDYLIQSKTLRQEQLALAEKNNAVNADSVAEAKRLAQEWANVTQEITRAGQHILTDIAPGILELLHGLGTVLDRVEQFGGIGKTLRTLANPLGSVGSDAAVELYNRLTAPAETQKPKYTGGAIADDDPEFYAKQWEKFKLGLGNSVKYADSQYAGAQRAVDPWQKAQLMQTIAATETQLGIPAGLLARIAEQESHFRPDIISGKTKSKAGAVGLMQLMPQFFPGAGKSAEADIFTAGKELRRLYKVFGDWSKAVAAYNDGEGNIKKVLAGKKTLPEETRKYLAAVAPTPGLHAGSSANNAANNTTTVAANITVHSNSADPTAVADQTAAALQRKISAAQAFQGQS